jgi:hypothetical protein
MTSKKDYVKAANLVLSRRSKNWENVDLADKLRGELFCDELENTFVKLFSGDNPRFDEGKFRKACKGE